MKNSIELRQISKAYREKTVLDHIDLEISEGELFGLLGPSGAGKTTMIKILTGQLRASGGEAFLLGTDVRKITDELYSKIGMVLDNSGLYTRLSCYDNLALFADIYKLDKKNIRAILLKVGLDSAIKLPVSSLSKGMSQRLVLARAIMNSPKLLFLDEPTSGLDPATAEEIHRLIIALKDNGTTVFLTTHNMAEASKLCDNVALLNDGKIIEYGKPDAVCRKYNKIKMISLLLSDGECLELPNEAGSADIIAEYLREERIEAIHSSEPDLESVFLELTGRRLA